MSKSGSTSTDQSTDQESQTPRAVLHKNILDTAQQRPDASMKELADEITGATTSIVERVLRQYGDPVTEQETEEQETTDTETATPDKQPVTDGASSSAGPVTDKSFQNADSSSATHSKTTATGENQQTKEFDASSNSVTSQIESPDDQSNSTDNTDQTAGYNRDSVPNMSELTGKQRETLEMIQEMPSATQAELADELDIASATINQRVNSIDGFDWADRHTFIEVLFSSDKPTPTVTQESADEDDLTSSATMTANPLDTPSKMTESNDAHKTSDSESHTEWNAEECESISSQIAELNDQIRTLEQQIDTTTTSSGFADPKLAHKVIHACIKSENFSEDEELEVIESIVV